MKTPIAVLLAAGILAIFAAPSAAPAAQFFVNSTSDGHDAVLDGVCAAAGSGLCTLRAAVEEAQAQAQVDAIRLEQGEYVLDLGGLPDLLYEANHLWIVGQGPYQTVIRGSAAGSHFIDVYGGLVLLDLQIKEFDRQGDVGGVALVYPGGQMLVQRCVLWGNSAPAGGSIYSGGNLTVRDTAFAFGSATHSDPTQRIGGEIVAQGTFLCERCIFEAASARGGGAVLVAYGSATIRDSFFSGNGAVYGGAIATIGESSTEISNSTFHGNFATTHGGGIANLTVSSSISVHSSTFTANRADTDLDYVGRGGAVHNCCANGSRISNSILSGNLGTLRIIEPIPVVLEWPQDCSGPFVSNGYNLVLNNSQGFCQLSIPPIASDPGLGPLRYNGGMTATMAIGPDSVAFNAGDPSGCRNADDNLLEFDQRGSERHAFGRCDLGAFEYGSLIFSDGFEPWGLLGLWSSHFP
jgi:hypothetical protein